MHEFSVVQGMADLNKILERRERVEEWKLSQLAKTKKEENNENHVEGKEQIVETQKRKAVDPLDAYMEEISQKLDEPQKLQIERTFEEDEALEYIPTTFAADDEEEDPMTMLEQSKRARRNMVIAANTNKKLEPFRKDFYIPTAEIARMTDEETVALRMELDNIKIHGKGCPKPVKKWSQCGTSLKALDIIKQNGYERPTPIQAQAIPAIMSGRDVIGIAKTGSGKTVAFLLPMFRHVLDQRKLGFMEGPIAIIMTPTRELAVQIQSECLKFAKAFNLRSLCAYGGSGMREQINALKRGVEIIVCTPGRLTDLLMANSGKVTNLKRVTFVVLDEADRMFDMGFEPQVLNILQGTRSDRQTVLFSATFPKQMEALARRILKKPLEILVGGRSVVCDDVSQIVHVLNEDDKFVKLLAVLGQWYETNARRILVFVDRQDSADYLFRDLLRKGYPCISLHGGKDQSDRESTISDFKNGHVSIMIATSVAARGLDVKELDLVINYDCPNHLEDYVHRVGRTGRAGQKGTAITFICYGQEKYSVDLVRALKESNALVPDELEQMATKFKARVKSGDAFMPGSGFRGKGLEKIEEQRQAVKEIQTKTYIEQEEEPKEEKAAKEKKTVQSSLKAAQEAAAKISEAVQIESGDVMHEINSRFQRTASSKVTDAIFSFTTADNLQAFCSEVEINDYSQAARWKITSREAINQLNEFTGTTLTVRGSFYPPGKPVVGGDRKLYIRIEGETEQSVEKARIEIKRSIVEATLEASRGNSDTSKYSVL